MEIDFVFFHVLEHIDHVFVREVKQDVRMDPLDFMDSTHHQHTLY